MLNSKDLKQLPVYWIANKKAWATSAEFTEWFNNYLVLESETYMKKNSLDFKVLLLDDNASFMRIQTLMVLTTQYNNHHPAARSRYNSFSLSHLYLKNIIPKYYDHLPGS